MMEPLVCLDYYAIRIYFGEVLHLHVKRAKLLAVQSWTDGEKNYSIEYVLRGGSIRTQYGDFAIWRSILNALDSVL
jgi:hypothetical protein